MRILLTGCKGQLGQEIIKRCSESVSLLALDSTELDITDRDAVMKVTSDFLPDFIVNAAAYTAVDKAESDTNNAWRVNRDGPSNLALVASEVGAAFIHISTDYVFSGLAEEAYLEQDVTQPQTVYGKSKLAGEKEVRMLCQKHIIIRTSWVFGEYGNNFVKTMLRLSAERDELSVVADQYGAPTYAGDIASAIFHIIAQLDLSDDNSILWGTYHYSGMPYVSWYEFAQAIFAKAEQFYVLPHTPELKPIPSSSYPTPAKRPANSKLNCQKIEKNFGIMMGNWSVALNNIQAYKQT